MIHYDVEHDSDDVLTNKVRDIKATLLLRKDLPHHHPYVQKLYREYDACITEMGKRCAAEYKHKYGNDK